MLPRGLLQQGLPAGPLEGQPQAGLHRQGRQGTTATCCAPTCFTPGDHGYAGAQLKLGNLFYKGRGVKQDYSEAAKCFRKAAERGHAEAQFNLGKSYYNGHGTNNIIPRPLSVTKIGK